jgi:hypothetical protein
VVVGTTQKEDETKEVVGLKLYPSLVEPNVPANNIGNLDEAVQRRIFEKQRKPEITSKQRKELDTVVKSLIKHTFSKSNILEFIRENPSLCDMRSKRWSIERFEKAVSDLYADLAPEYAPKPQVKKEQMPNGKPPRMILSDGDRAQIMSLVVMSCMEACMKKCHKYRTTKGAEPFVQLDKLLTAMRHPGGEGRKGATVEGDGKSWDTTCSLEIRQEIENKIINHILDILLANGMQDPVWAEALKKVSTQAFLDLKMKEKGRESDRVARWIIAAIRRSGDRGTSILNWITNFVCWVAALFGNDSTSVNNIVTSSRKNRVYKDRWGIMRFFTFFFEGDDSLLFVEPRPSQEQWDEVTEYWRQLGFNMTLFVRLGEGDVDETVATAVGHRIEVDALGPTGLFCPEITRAFEGGPFSTSGAAITAARELDGKKCRMLAATAMASRSYLFAGKVPTLSEKFLSEALAAAGEQPITLDAQGEMERKFGLESGGDLFDKIATRNAEAVSSEVSEVDFLRRLGYPATEVELQDFVSTDWKLCLADVKYFRDHVPPGWGGDMNL